MSLPAALDDSDFGQRVDLTVRIREVLAAYPAGLSILKELVQNADDAGASVVKLCFDQRSHGVTSLAYPGLAAFQGPALLAYNDAEFTAADFASIQSIGNSGKRTGGDSTVAGANASTAAPKTGRFGLGFNSAYHITDVPSFVSGNSICYFDPHATNLPLTNVNNPGKRINFLSDGAGAAAVGAGGVSSASSSLLDRFPDQFKPLVAFGCTLRSHFAGTLFRFPLRTPAQSLTSKLSKHAYSAEDMEELMRSMYAEASEMLLFLKHVSRIEVHRWTPSAEQPRCEFAVGISNLTPTLKQHRAFLTTCTQAMLAKLQADVDLIDEVELTSERFDHDQADASASDVAVAASASGPSITRSVDTWLTSNKLSAGTALRMALDPVNEHFRFLPWGGTAACLKRGGAYLTNAADQVAGRAYCFLPLPIQTHMPAHTNGFFELSSNRRDIWWGGDMKGDGLVRSQWNEALCLELIAPTYAALLHRASRMLAAAAPDAFHALMPMQLKTSEAWVVTIARLYALIQDVPLLLTRTAQWKPAQAGGRPESAKEGGTWITPRDAITVDELLPSDTDVTVLNADGTETVIPASVAPFPLLPTFGPMASLLLACSLPVVRMPSKVQRLMVLYAPKSSSSLSSPSSAGRASSALAAIQPIGPRHVDPGFVRTWLIQLGALPSVLDRAHALFLLQFVLSDLQSSQPSSFLKLVGVPLLPTMRGGFTKFAQRSSAIAGWAVAQPVGAAAASSASALPTPATFYVLSASDVRHNVPSLLSAASHALVSVDLAPAVSKVLSDPALFGVLNLAALTESAVAAELLKFCMPQSWRGVDVVAWTPSPAVSPSAAASSSFASAAVPAPVAPYSVPTMSFVHLLWSYISRCKDLSLFTMYPLALTLPGILTNDSATGAISQSPLLCRLTKATHLIHPGSAEMLQTPFSSLLSGALCKMRIHVLDTSVPSMLLPHPSLFDLGLVSKPSLSAFIGLLSSLCGNDPSRLTKLLEPLTAPERKALRRWIGGMVTHARQNGAALSVQEHAWIKALPIFQVHLDHKAFTRRGPPKPAATAASAAAPVPASSPAPNESPKVDDEWNPGLDDASSFVDLSIAPRQLPPPASLVAPHLLSSKFLLLSLSSDAALFAALGVASTSAADFFRDYFFPASNFSRLHPAERDETLERLLGDLPVIAKQSPTFQGMVAGLAFLPTKGGSLHKAAELYDPEMPDLGALLDPELHFPQTPFNSPAILAVLRSLGLQRMLDRNGILESALSVYKSAQQGMTMQEEQQKKNAASSPGTVKSPVSADPPLPRPEDELMNRALARSKALLCYVESHAGRLFAADTSSGSSSGPQSGSGDIPKAQWLSSLLAIPWLPVLVDPPSAILPWNSKLVHGVPGSRHRDPPFLASPMDSRPAQDAWLCSYSLRLLAAPPIINATLLANMEWDRPLNIKVLATQIVQLSHKLAGYGPPLGEIEAAAASGTAAAAAESFPEPSSSERIRVSEQRELLEQLSTIVPQLYRLLSHSVSDSSLTPAQRGDNLATLRSQLHGESWLLMGDRFISTDKVAFASCSPSLDAEPYFFRLPAELRIFGAFLRAMGVREMFQTGDYVEVLNSMASVYGSSSGIVAPTATKTAPGAAVPAGASPATAVVSAAKPLSDRDLATAITIVQFLSDHISEIQSSIFVPTEHRTLALAQTLVFQDAAWLDTKRRANIKSSAAYLFVHPKISNAVAETVGVKSYRATLLASMSDVIGVEAADAGESIGARGFGQKESLVQRLKNILALYPEGVGVLYELLQNADDAKATELTLMLNCDSYGTASLLSSKMEGWQGPALYAWNNAQFSEQDFQNLSTIGQGSKLDKLSATGRFGLGFNAMYHVTDVPSFVSGDSIVMFDPHSAFLPGVSHREPGLRIPISPALMEAFPEQFQPYLFFGCDMQRPYGATLFRFPLRTEATAAKSGIKRESSSKKEMLALLEQFRAVIVESMLFLRHIIKISIMVHENQATRVLFSAECKDKNQREKGVWAKIPAFAGAKSATQQKGASSSSSSAAVLVANAQLSKSSFYARLESCREEDLPRGFTVANIVLSRFEYVEGPPDLAAMVLSEHTPAASPCPSPQPSPPPVYTLRSTVVSTDTFLISEQIGWGRSRILAIEGSKKGLKMLPFGGVAAHILHDGLPVQSSTALAGRAFCFLPLPVTTGLPVSSNAFFELSANRRDIWWGSDMTGDGAIRSDWNRSLLLDVVAPSYARLLTGAARLLGTSSPQFNQLFPFAAPVKTVSNSSATTEAWACLTARVYALLQNVPVLFTRCVSFCDPETLVAAASGAAPAGGMLAGFDYARIVADLGVEIHNRDRALEAAQQGQWIAPKHAVCLTIEPATRPAISPAKLELIEEKTVVSSGASSATPLPALPAEVPLAFPEFGRLGSILLVCGVPIVQMPSALRLLLVQNAQPTASALPTASASTSTSASVDLKAGPRLVDPGFIRLWLREMGTVPPQISRADTMFLLHYVLSDLNKATYAELHGVPLVPLYNGKFGVFGTNGQAPAAGSAAPSPSASKPLAAPSPQFFFFSADDVKRRLSSLLAPAAHLLLSPALDADVMRVLCDPAFAASSNVQALNEANVAQLLPFCLPQQYRGLDIVEYVEPATSVLPVETDGVVRSAPAHAVPSLMWLKQLWFYLNTYAKDLGLFTAMPIVLANGYVQAAAQQAAPAIAATSTSSSPSVAPAPVAHVVKPYLCRLSPTCRLLSPDRASPFASPLLTLLTKLSILVLDSGRVAVTHEAQWNYISKPTVAGFLACVDGICGGDLKRMPALFSKTSSAERIALREWVGRSVSAKTLEGGLNQQLDPKEVQLLRHMHIYEAFSGAADATAPTRANNGPVPTAQPVRSGAAGITVASPKPNAAALSPPPAATLPSAPAALKTFVFVDLTSQSRFVPPEHIAESLLTSRFLKLALKTDTELLLLLGVEAMAESDFYLHCVFPPAILGRLTPAERNATMERVLNELPHLTKDNPGFIVQLTALKFLPTAAQAEGEAAVLSAIGDLFDPSVAEFHALLDPARHFPSAPFNQPHLLQTLVRLGLQTSLDRAGVLDVASSIVSTVARSQSLSQSGVIMERARSKALLQYVDLHSKRLLEADPAAEGEEQKSGQKPATSSAVSPSSAAPSAVSADRFMSRATFVSRLIELAWLPALTMSPSPLLPWPPTQPGALPASLAFASARRARPLSDAWSCSYTLKILDGEIKTQALIEALGWAEPFSAIVLCQQLLKLSEATRDASAAGPQSAAALLSSINVHVPRMYSQLTQLIGRGVESEKAIMVSTLKGGSWLYHAGQWYTSARFAFPPVMASGAEGAPAAPAPIEGLSGAIAPDASPYLVFVPFELMPFAPLLTLLGVRSQFDAMDYAFVLKRIAQEEMGRMQLQAATPAATSPQSASASSTASPTLASSSTGQLSERELDLCISIVNYLGCLQDDRNAVAVAQAAGTNRSPKLSLLIKPTDLYLPSDKNHLIEATKLSFNDAAWLLATLPSPESIHFVHNRISNALAAKLGVKSLRELLLLNQSFKKDIYCPTPAGIQRTIEDLLGPQICLNEQRAELDETAANAALPLREAPNAAGIDALTTAFFDLVELGDSLGAKECKVIVDERRFASESLFNPLLAQAQGPALVLYFDTPLLSEEVIWFQAKAMESAEEGNARNVTIAPPSTPQSSSSSSSAAPSIRSGDVHNGHGLLSAYAFADSMFVLSGESLFVFDPLKKLFIESSAGAESSAAAASSAAAPRRPGAPFVPPAASVAPKSEASYGRQYVFTSGGGQPLGARFKDQFSVFEELPFRFSSSKPFSGTIIRLPLRHYGLDGGAEGGLNAAMGASLSKAIINKPIMDQFVSSLKPHNETLLLFARSLESFSLAVQPAHMQAPSIKVCTAYVQVHAKLRSQRQMLTSDDSWKRAQKGSGFLGMFSTAFAPRRNFYELEISTLTCNPRGAAGAGGAAAVDTNVDLYLVAETLGEGQTREMAVRWINESASMHGGTAPNNPVRARVGREQPATIGGIVPIASVAVRLKRNGQNAEALSDARLFCGGVPLLSPQAPLSGMPLHLNGQFAVRRSSTGRFLHFDPGYMDRFAKSWSMDIAAREKKLRDLANPAAMPAPPQPPPSPPDDSPPASKSASSNAAPAYKGGLQISDADWAPSKKPSGPSSSSGSSGSGSGDRPPPLPRDDSDDDEEEKNPERPAAAPAPAPAPALPSAQAIQLAQRQSILEIDNVASQRSAVHRWNIELISAGQVTAYVEQLTYLAALFAKQGSRTLLYKYFPFTVTASHLLCRLLLKPMYERIRDQQLPLFLSSNNEYQPLKSALFKHPQMGLLTEGFITRFYALFQVPNIIADDLLLTGVSEGIRQNDSPTAPLLPACVCTPFEFRRLLRVLAPMREALSAGVTSDVSRELLRFALLDLGSTPHTNDRYSELSGLRLAPQANGATGVFGSRRFVLTPGLAQALLPIALEIFLSDSVLSDPALMMHLQTPSFSRHFLEPFNAKLVAQYLGRLFPSQQQGLFASQKRRVLEWRVKRKDLQQAWSMEDRPLSEGEDKLEVVEGSVIELPPPATPNEAHRRGASQVSSSASSSPRFPVSTANGLPSPQFCRVLWQFISLRSAENRGVLSSWPLIPLRSKQKDAAAMTAGASAASSVLKPATDDRNSAETALPSSDDTVVHHLATTSLFPYILCLPSAESWSQSTDVAEALLQLGYPLLDFSFFDSKYRSDNAIPANLYAAAPAAAAAVGGPRRGGGAFGNAGQQLMGVLGGLVGNARAGGGGNVAFLGANNGAGGVVGAADARPVSLSLCDKVESIPLKFIRSLPDLFMSRDLNVNLSTLKENHCNTLLKLINDGFTAGAFTVADKKTVRLLPIFQIYTAAASSSSADSASSSASSSSASAAPLFRSLDSLHVVHSPLFMLSPELIGSLPAEFLSFLAAQHCFLTFKFPQLHAWLGVQELTKTMLLERFLFRFLSEQFSAAAVVAGAGSGGGAGENSKLDQFIQAHLVEWVRESVLSAETKKQLSAHPLIPVSWAAQAAVRRGGEEGKEQAEGDASSAAATASASSASAVSTVRVPASSLYDPRNRFFSDCFNGTPVFPAASYQTEELLTFLVDLGMKKTMDAEAFVLCAKKIEETTLARKPMPAVQQDGAAEPDATGISTASSTSVAAEESRMFAVAVRLLDHLIGHFTDLSSPKLWSSLKGIRWVPVRFRGVALCVRFEEVAHYKDRFLCWTSLPVLAEMQSPPEVIHNSMQLQSPPPVSAVMAHLATITAVPLDQWDTRLKMQNEVSSGGLHPTRVFIELFSYLEQHWSSLSVLQQSALMKMPLVPIAGALVRPSRLYFRLTTSLSPLMFEVPRVFGQYDALFTKLGTTAFPKRRDYLRLLNELYIELMPDRTLNVNELQAVIKVIQLLADKTDQADDEDDAELLDVEQESRSAKSAAKFSKLTSMAGGKQPAAAASPSSSAGSASSRAMLVYVPDELTRLVPAFSCVFSDSAWLSQRISHSKLHFVNNGVAHELSRKVGVRALTDAIEERLEKLVNIEDDPSLRAALSPAVCAALQRLWNSVEFARGVIRLFEDNISRSKQYAQWQLIPSVDSLHALLRSYTLQFVASIRTRLILIPERTDVTLDDGSQHSGSLAFVFIDYQSSAKTVYINCNMDEISSIRPTLILANALAQILSKSIPGLDALRNLTPLNSLLDTALLVQDDPARDPASLLQPLLDHMDIVNIDHVSQRRGVVGELLHAFDAAMINLMPLRKYYAGELVAFRDQQGQYRYGQIVRDETQAAAEAAASATGAASSSAVSSSAVAAAATVPFDVPAFSTLLVRIHPSKNALLSSADLFSFSSNMSAQSAGDDAEKMLQSNLTMMQQINAKQQGIQKASGPVMQRAQAESGAAVPALIASAASSSSPSSSSSAAAASSSSSAVAGELDRSRTQLLSAVVSLLHQAHLPLSLERETLVRENLQLRQAAEQAEKRASAAYKRESELTSQIERLQTAFLCVICQTADVDTILGSCGHMVCATCEKQLRKTCPFCRKHYAATIPFFKPSNSA